MEQTDLVIIDEASRVSDLLTVREVAHQLRVDSTTVRRWIHQGILPAVQLPSLQKYKRYRIKRTELARIVGKSV